MLNIVLGLMLIAVSRADWTNLSYNSNLKCGACIKSGYNFCFVGIDGQQVDNETSFERTCCQDDTCAQMTNSSWSCSKSYNDTDYALTFCPQPKNKCGGQWKFDFSNNKNVTTDITIGNLSQGESCTLKIKSDCGAPGFQIKNDTTNITDSKIYITYIEYN